MRPASSKDFSAFSRANAGGAGSGVGGGAGGKAARPASVRGGLLRNLTKKGVAQDCPATGAGAKAAHASIGRALEEGQMVFFTFKGASTRAGGEPFVFETRPSPQGALPAGTTMRQDYDAFRANYRSEERR